MVTGVVQQLSMPSPITSNSPKIFHSISYDSRENSIRSRKRFYSERNVSILKFPYDDDGVFKRMKKGNCVISFYPCEERKELADVYFRLDSCSFSNFLPPTFDKANDSSTSFFFFPTNRFILP